MSPSVVAAAAADAASSTPLAVLEELLTHSIQLRDLYKSARRQISSGQHAELHRILDEHYKEQLSLIDVIVDRIRLLGGAVGVFASDFLQGEQSCRLLRGPGALNRLLHDFLDAHESILGAACEHDSNDHHPSHDFAVGVVVLANEKQCDSITEVLLTSESPLRFRQADF